jgi:hypothetical protein
MGALFLACFLVWKVAPVVRKWSRFIDRVTGVPEDPKTGQKEILGIFERMDHQDAVLETIRHEVEFNNGSSVKDAITRTEKHAEDIGTKLDVHLAACPSIPQHTTITVNGGPS